jgi:hypothetical protein
MHKSIFTLTAVYSLDNEVRFRAKSNLLIVYRPYHFMHVERHMSVNVSVVILFLFPNVNLVLKNNSVRFACKAVHFMYHVRCPVAVQLVPLFGTCIKKVRANDLDLHTCLKTLSSVL